MSSFSRARVPYAFALTTALSGLVHCSSDDPKKAPDVNAPDADAADSGADSSGALPLAVGQIVPYPTTEWTVKAPADLDMDAALLEQACDYALNFDGNGDGTPDMNTQGVVIIRGGALVHECYAPGKTAQDSATSWSVAKSFVSTLIGIAMDEGLIPDVDVKMSTYFSEWLEDERRDIRLEDLLLMQSGLAFREEYVDASAEIVKLFTSEDADAFARSLPYERPPGDIWYYSSGDSQLLGATIASVKGKAAGDWAKEKIFDPLGMTTAQWWKDGSGNTATYCCLDATIRDFAKFGLLALREGKWGDQTIVSSGWIRRATQTLATKNPGYAYQWWTQGSLKNDIPEYPDLYWADGLDQQKIFVIPSLDLVVAKNSLYTKPDGAAEAAPGSGVFSKIAPRGLNRNGGTVGPLVWQDVALLAPIINSIAGSTKVEFTPLRLGARPPDPAACRDAASTGYGTFCEPVHGCACDACSPEFLDCDANEGCAAIINCALETGCRGIECATPCAQVIAQFGGTGTGGIEVQMALSLSECVVAARCGTSCN